MTKQNNELQGNPYPQTLERDEIDLLNIFHVLKAQRNVIALIIIISVVIGIVTALLLPRYYEVSITVVPAEQTDVAQSEINSMARIAGLGVSSTPVTEKEIGLLFLQSRKFILTFIDKHNITPHLYGSGDENIAVSIPQPAEIYEDFMKLFSVEQDALASDITFSLAWKDAELAKTWITALLLDLNDLMKERAKVKGKNSLNFLMLQLSETNDAEVRQSFVGMIKKETQKLMLADIREEYLFETIDTPLIPAYPSRPNRTLIVILFAVFGFILGVFIGIYRQGQLANSQ